MQHLPNSATLASSLSLLNLDPPQFDSRQKFLRFSLGPQDSGLLPLEEIGEVLHVNVLDILPVPEMPACVLGIYNWRGNMLWLIDLEHLIDCPASQQRQAPFLMAMVVQVDEQYLGLVVQAVKDIELHDATQMQSATAGLFPAKLLPFVKGYLPSADGTVLDVEAIARSPMWQVHRS